MLITNKLYLYNKKYFSFSFKKIDVFLSASINKDWQMTNYPKVNNFKYIS